MGADTERPVTFLATADCILSTASRTESVKGTNSQPYMIEGIAILHHVAIVTLTVSEPLLDTLMQHALYFLARFSALFLIMFAHLAGDSADSTPRYLEVSTLSRPPVPSSPSNMAQRSGESDITLLFRTDTSIFIAKQWRVTMASRARRASGLFAISTMSEIVVAN